MEQNTAIEIYFQFQIGTYSPKGNVSILPIVRCVFLKIIESWIHSSVNTTYNLNIQF